MVPHGALFRDGLAKTVVLEILAQAEEEDGIRFEGEDVTFVADQAGRKQREEANVGAQIVKDRAVLNSLIAVAKTTSASLSSRR